MKKFLLALLLVGLSVNAANAQRRQTVSGVVADMDTRQSLIGVVVGISPAADSTAVTNLVTGAGGVFSTGLVAGDYDFTASMVGYNPVRQRATVGNQRLTLDTLFIRQGIEIEAVVKSVVALRTSLSGDTLIYNADAYKVASDANVSGLLEKMPGIKVEDGAVEAQGEAVKKVLIDGREFFGEDVSAAISSLPAEAVKSIEVFDKLSDNAEFTGIDDGEGYKAINITTRESMRQGIMGQVSALYGIEPAENNTDKAHHYGLVGGNVSIFQGDAKITVGGTLNNLNERHFTSEDILGAGDNDGIAKVGRFQINYIDELGKRNQWKIDASYRFDVTDTEDHSIIDREYFQTDQARYLNYSSDTWRTSVNRNHAINARIDFKPNANHELRIRPFLRFQGNQSHRDGEEIYYPADGMNNIHLNNWSDRNESGYMTGLNMNYRVRLGKPGRTLSMFFNTAYDPDDRDGETYSERQDGTPVRQHIPSFNYDFNIGGGLTYTEPISKNSLVNLDYSIRYNYSDNDRKSYLWDFSLDEYYSTPDTELSGVYNSGYLTHRVGPGYRMQKGETTLSAGVFYQYSTLESERVLPIEMDLKNSFSNLTYSVMLNTQWQNDISLRVFLNSRTQNPSVNNLQDVVDISNVQHIRKGNPNLRPSYGNMLYTRLIIPNTEKGRTLSFNIGGFYSLNSIVDRTIRESPGYQVLDSQGNVVETLDAVGDYTEPVNMDGEWSARFGVDYGFPVKFLRSNLNIDANVSYQESPSQMGSWREGMSEPTFVDNYSRALNTGGRLTLGSNISEKVDFRLRYGVSYNNVRNTFSDRSNSAYLRHRIDGEFKFVFPLGFTFSGNAMFNTYDVLEGEEFSQQYFIANAGVGKKIFRNQQGEVSLFVNDIFNQNVSFRRRPYPQYIQNEINSVVGRYFGVKFTWNIRKFGKNGSMNMDLYDMGGHQGHNHGGRGGRY